MALYDRVNYYSNLQYVISSYVREYDIRKANISVLYNKGAITLEQYNYFYNLDNDSRKVKVGLLQRDNPELAKILSSGILEMKKLFFEYNNIQDHEVLGIKNDAIFLINKIPTITKFGNVEFIPKHTYTSFYYICKKEFYYYYDSISNTEIFNVKGIDKGILPLHKDFFIEFLCTLFCSMQTETLKDSIELFNIFYNRYINLELDIEYYRPLDSNIYRLKGTRFSSFGASELIDDCKVYLDIGYNLNILRELYGIISSIYYSSIKKGY